MSDVRRNKKQYIPNQNYYNSNNKKKTSKHKNTYTLTLKGLILDIINNFDRYILLLLCIFLVCVYLYVS